ncbi:peptidylprolyl isomerase [Bacillus mycoides]|uniref:peptidylprolyl isomerase n=1 Tax=Bacillus mycoides TaxID=1405 RepID=UPI0038059047
MKKWMTVIIIAAGISTLAGCSTSPTLVKTNVGDVTKDDLNTYLENKNGEAAIREVVLQKVLEKKYPVTDQEIEKQFKQIKEKQGLSSLPGMHAGEQNEEKVKEQVKQQLVRTEAMKQLITEKDLKKAYHPEIKVRHILLDSQEKAVEVKQRLENGESFEEVVKSESNDIMTKQSGGELDFRSGFGLSEVEKAAQTLEVNKISDPIESRMGHHLIEVTEKGETKEWKNVSQKEKDVLREKVMIQKQQDGTMDKLFQNILDEAKIEVKEDMYKHVFDKK